MDNVALSSLSSLKLPMLNTSDCPYLMAIERIVPIGLLAEKLQAFHKVSINIACASELRRSPSVKHDGRETTSANGIAVSPENALQVKTE